MYLFSTFTMYSPGIKLLCGTYPVVSPKKLKENRIFILLITLRLVLAYISPNNLQFSSKSKQVFYKQIVNYILHC